MRLSGKCRRARRRRFSVALVGVVLAGSVGLAWAAHGPPTASAAQQPVRVAVERTQPTGRSELIVGVTHTQYSVDSWGDADAVQRGRQLLDGLGGLHNQHIYGWGTRNPNPQPGTYDWRSLDRRIDAQRSLDGQQVITLCCAPDWMTRKGTHGSDYPNVPPTPDNYGEFAALAARIARRYPHVKHYVVWNEFKGFWDRAANNWDYRAYTALYNRVWRALKDVDPSIQVGGPYLVIEGTGSREMGKRGYASAEPITRRNKQALRYWLENKLGADFLAVDRKTVSGSHDRNRYTRAQYLELTRWFGSVSRSLRAETALPIWYMEDYFVNAGSAAFQAAGLASMLAEHVRSGAAVSLRWGPQGQAGARPNPNKQSLFSDTRHSDGGRPYPAYLAYWAVQRHFGRGTPLYRTTSSSPLVDALASRTHVLLINRSPSAIDVRVQGRRGLVELAGYGVALVTERSLIEPTFSRQVSPDPARLGPRVRVDLRRQLKKGSICDLMRTGNLLMARSC